MYKDVQRTNVNEVFGWAVMLSGGPRAPAAAANTAGMARDAYTCYLRRNLACRRPTPGACHVPGLPEERCRP
eukprot:409035-Prymnesium_polylepis.1